MADLRKKGSLLAMHKAAIKRDGTDTLASILKVILSAAPVVGSPLAGLITEFIPSRKSARLEQFLLDVAVALEDLNEKIDTKFIQTDQFAFIFQQIL